MWSSDSICRMAARLSLLFAIIIRISHGLVLDAPRETRPARSYAVEGWTPAPTMEPLAFFHGGLQRAALDTRALFERDYANTQTCGWISKDANNALTCPDGLGCAYWPAVPFLSKSFGLTQGAINCCPVAGTSSYIFSSCTPAVACEDYNSRVYDGSDETTIDGTIRCGAAGAACATYSFLGGPSDRFGGPDSSSLAAQTYTALYCTTQSSVDSVYQVTTNVLSTPPPSSTMPSSSSSSPSTKTGASSSSSNSNSGNGSGKGGSSSNVGVIAGATVGGVVAIAAVAAVVGFLVWRKRRQSIPPTREISTYEGSTYGGGAGGSLYSPVPQGQEYGQNGYPQMQQQPGYGPPGSYNTPGPDSSYGGSNHY